MWRRFFSQRIFHDQALRSIPGGQFVRTEQQIEAATWAELFTRDSIPHSAYSMSVAVDMQRH
jgi:hypothetical protein